MRSICTYTGIGNFKGLIKDHLYDVEIIHVEDDKSGGYDCYIKEDITEEEQMDHMWHFSNINSLNRYFEEEI